MQSHDPDMYFSPDYQTARRRLLMAADRLKAKRWSLSWGLRGPAGEELAIDIVWLGSRRARRALVHSSALHGVEGFAGSAIQLQLLARPPELAADSALIVIHCINPYGMAWLRRVNESNVDLNRNFFLDAHAPRLTMDGYHQLHALLNPRNPRRPFEFFRQRIAWAYLRGGVKRMQLSVVKGQYDYPEGLFFGGLELQEGPRQMLRWLEKETGSLRRAIWIDVHTGLGRFGDHIIILEQCQQEGFRARLKERYQSRLDEPNTAGAQVYQVTGGIEQAAPTFIRRARVDFLTQEFGTRSPMTILESLREENRLFQLQGGRKSLLHREVQALRDAFAPNDLHWKRSILEKGRQLLENCHGDLLDNPAPR